MNHPERSAASAAHFHPSAASSAGAANPAARLLRALAHEALALLGEGVDAATVERAGIEGLHLSRGPLALIDDLSLDVIDRELHESLGGHGHSHGHAHGPEHDHAHEASCGHTHEHEHDHTHGPACGHAEHAHEHRHQDAHGHDHAHDNACGHDHDHEHEDGHDHAHGLAPHAGHDHHEQEHAQAAEPTDPDALVPGQPPPLSEAAIYVVEKMAHGYGRHGRAHGRGFYEYDEDDPEDVVLWSGLKSFARRNAGVDAQAAAERLRYAVVLEAFRCLQDDADPSPRKIDHIACSTLGIANPSHAPLTSAAAAGLADTVRGSQTLAERWGVRFSPPAVLLDHAHNGTLPQEP